MLPVDIPYIIFILITIFAVVLNEKVEERVIRRYFSNFIREIEKLEDELNQYYAMSILAVAMNDREAYKGFQNIINEKYWPLFFRKILFTTSLYFILLTPYMFVSAIFIKNAFSTVLFIAIFFFTIKLGYTFVKDSVNAWKAWKEAKDAFR